MGRDFISSLVPQSANRLRLSILSTILALLVIAFVAFKLCFVDAPTTLPPLPQQWHAQAYELDDDEVLRLVPPPFSPMRMQILKKFTPTMPTSRPRRVGQLCFITEPLEWAEGHRLFGTYGDGEVIDAAMCATIPTGRYVNKEIETLPLPGDWIVRGSASEQRRVQALRPMLKVLIGKDVIFEKGTEDKEVTVLQGTWKFQPLQPQITTSSQVVQLFTGKAGDRVYIQTGTGDFPTLVKQLARWVPGELVDETQGVKPLSIEWESRSPGMLPLWDNPVAWQQFAQNIEKQTSLRFVKAKRAMPVWYVYERGATTRPGGG